MPVVPDAHNQQVRSLCAYVLSTSLCRDDAVVVRVRVVCLFVTRGSDSVFVTEATHVCRHSKEGTRQLDRISPG